MTARRASSPENRARSGPPWALAGVATILVALGLLGLWLTRETTGTNESNETASSTNQLAGATSEIPRIPNLDQLDPRVAEAVHQAVTAIEAAPANGAAWGNLGRVYQSHQYFDLARRCYRKARELDPGAAAWPYTLGVLAAERGELADAISLLEEASHLDPAYRPTHYRLGDALLRAGRLDEAADSFQKLRGWTEGEVWRLAALARVAERRGQWTETARLLEQARGLDPKDREVLYLLGTAYRELGRRDEAAGLLAGLDSAERRELPDPWWLDALRQRVDLQGLIASANRRLADGRAEEAEALYLEVIAYDPNHFDALFNLGVLYGRGGRYDDAVGALEKALAQEPDASQARFLLALAYASSDRYQQAEATALELQRRDPNNPKSRELLEQLRASRVEIERR